MSVTLAVLYKKTRVVINEVQDFESRPLKISRSKEVKDFEIHWSYMKASSINKAFEVYCSRFAGFFFAELCILKLQKYEQSSKNKKLP